MCGIFGYIGKKTNAAEMVLDGLKLLEYRGYDSWGVAAKIQNQESSSKNQGLVVEKHVGKIGDSKLSEKLTTSGSSLAIGHTRWATHGGVTDVNAHPHLDCTHQIAVLHNGIIENFQELKSELIQKGHVFISETDTEVFAHLVEENLKSSGFTTSVRDAFNRISGLNAVVVTFAGSREIIAAKTGSPLVVGKADDGLYIASDASGIIKHTKNVLFVKDKEMVILGDDVTLLSLPSGDKITPAFQTIDWEIEESDKGEYPHFLLKEIHEQPRIIENIALTYSDNSKKLAQHIEGAFGTFMLGCGTASYAALAGTYIFSKIAKKHVNFSSGSEFNYLEDYITKNSLVIPITQSGETIDVVEPVQKAKEKGATIAAVTNVLGSTIYRLADYSVLLGAGPERAVVGTKSFIAMIAVLLQTAYEFVNKGNEIKDLLLESAKDVKQILSEDFVNNIKHVAGTLKDSEHIYIIGRGLSYATAIEATLKIKETACLHAEGFAGGELKHGVIALISKGTPAIVFAPNDETYDAIISNAQEIKARGGYIIGIGPKANPVFDEFLVTADTKEATMISQVVISQLLAYYLALERGIPDPDKPRNLAKSVTVK